jgi:hypothetical protein
MNGLNKRDLDNYLTDPGPEPKTVDVVITVKVNVSIGDGEHPQAGVKLVEDILYKALMATTEPVNEWDIDGDVAPPSRTRGGK